MPDETSAEKPAPDVARTEAGKAAGIPTGAAERKPGPPTPQKTSNDWIAWSMYFAAGLVGGVMFALWFASKAVLAQRAANGPIPVCLAYFGGAALVAAGLVSGFGERLWSNAGSSIYMTHPEGFEQSRSGHLASVVAGCIGAAVFAFAILHH